MKILRLSKLLTLSLLPAILLQSSCSYIAYAADAKTDKIESEKAVETAAAVDPDAMLKLTDMTTVDALNRFMTYYYRHPQPELFVAALLLADRQGLLKGDSAPPLQAFASVVMAKNPDKLKDWYSQLGPMSEEGKTLILTSIWWSGTKEGKEILDLIADKLPEKSKIEFHKQIDKPAPGIDQMDIESPDLLDMLWACFCASGDPKYVKRLMTTLSWGKNDNKDLPKMLIASAAHWSLVSNINQHEKVKEACETEAKTNKELAPYIDRALKEAADKLAAKKNEAAKGDQATAKVSEGNKETERAAKKNEKKNKEKKSKEKKEKGKIAESKESEDKEVEAADSKTVESKAADSKDAELKEPDSKAETKAEQTQAASEGESKDGAE